MAPVACIHHLYVFIAGMDLAGARDGDPPFAHFSSWLRHANPEAFSLLMHDQHRLEQPGTLERFFDELDAYRTHELRRDCSFHGPVIPRFVVSSPDGDGPPAQVPHALIIDRYFPGEVCLLRAVYHPGDDDPSARSKHFASPSAAKREAASLWSAPEDAWSPS
jgi:hypothetical protein